MRVSAPAMARMTPLRVVVRCAGTSELWLGDLGRDNSSS
jgi:hypothetical protein